VCVFLPKPNSATAQKARMPGGGVNAAEAPVLSTASKRANALIWSSNIFNLANNAGTSVEQIERFYARNLPLSAEMAKNVQAFGDQ
jgi:hypothetical protein